MVPFLKMHGCGNDFVVLDARAAPLPALNWQLVADRNFGIGCDQVVILEPSTRASLRMRIINADGSEVASCGNASRCVGWLLRDTHNASIETAAGIITTQVKGNSVTVDMGPPRTDWQQIPLAQEVNTLHLPLTLANAKDAVAVSMGNPHAIFFVGDVDSVKLAELGPVLEHHALFPERANIEAAQIIDRNTIKLRVWERGSGLTLACGTGACATLVAAHLRGLTGRSAQVQLPGGTLQVEWQDNNHVVMSGSVAVSFEGSLDTGYYS